MEVDDINRQSLYARNNCTQMLILDSQSAREAGITIQQQQDQQVILFDEYSTKSYDGYTLVLPAVSVGNIGQLTMDLILENSKFSPVKIGRIFHPALEPVVGIDPPTIMTPCELYQTDNKLLLLQFHSPVGKRLRNDFIEFIVDWIESQRISRVVCLSSSFSSARNDSQLIGSQLRYLSSKIPNDVCNILKSHDILPLELRISPALATFTPDDQKKQIMVHGGGGGIAQILFDSLTIKSIPSLLLIVFASEAEELYSIANLALSLSGNSGKIKHPASWTNSLFYGNAPPADIY